MGFFSKIKASLQKTRNAMMQKMQSILNSFTKIDEELFEQLEETMIMSDMGVETSVEICERLRKLVKERGVKNPAEIMNLIEEIISDMMGEETELDLSTKPAVIMVIGVNGAGKTTTIGKLCYQFKNEGKKVLVAAADTFRAAAIDQLEVWTQRAGVDIVKHAEGSDPASVVYDAVTASIARNCDIVIVDTAGRLQNKKNLMDELAKMNRILQQRAEGCAIETLLVLDATTGQNAVNQARLFSEVANITGIVLTKLDGTAKGGIVVSIKNELGIPVKLVGVGEKIDDLQKFNNADFVKALFDHSDDVILDENVETQEIQEEEPEQKKSWFSFGKKKDAESEEVELVAEESEQIEPVAEEPEQVESVPEEPEQIEPVAEESEQIESVLEEVESEEIESIMKETETEQEETPKKKKSLFSRLFGKKED
ncbi:MAG: signal recognition particle-docking protein FtsY [Oscillospiraceae bacterium]|nr:signal recognition particle-docking protein FtsY [Oscillospiraceae bacterium]MDE6777388.1 signal recognition particle-docking protein FtsY [Oscillospiraceae bacterium]